MRGRLFFVAISVAALAACGGGGGNPNPCNGACAHPTSKPVVTPSPTPGSDRPAAAGDSFAYAGTMVQTFDRPPVTRDPIPSPNPTSSQTFNYTVTQAVTIASGTVTGGVGTFDFHTAESDVLGGGLETSSTAGDETYTFTPVGATFAIVDTGGTQNASSGTTYTTSIGTGNGLVDVIPESNGALSPANTAAMTVTETDPDSTTSTRTVAADGTYTEHIAFADGTTADASVNADGSGTYSLPLIVPSNSTFAVGSPAPNPSGTPYIPITITYAAGLFTTPNASPTPTIVDRTVSVWYPTPVSLYAQSIVVSTATAPAACALPSPFAGRATKAVTATTSTVDPVLGELDTRVSTDYDQAGAGVVCSTLSDTVQQFYDFSGQTESLIRTVSDPQQTTTTAETLGLTNEVVSTTGPFGAKRAPGVAFTAALERRALARHVAAIRRLRAAAAARIRMEAR